MSNDTLTQSNNLSPLPRVAARIDELAASIDLPPSTYRREEVEGRGCRTFLIGRRKYALLSDWAKWLESLAEKADAMAAPGE